MNKRVNSQQLQGIIRTVVFAGIIEILCILLSTGSSILIQDYYRNSMDEAYVITMNMNDISQDIYRYQNIMSDYIHEINKHEDYQQELTYNKEKIENKELDIEILMSEIGIQEIEESFLEFENYLAEYLEYEKEEISIQEFTNLFKRCTSQLGEIEMKLTEYSNLCKEESKKAESISLILNIIMIATAVVSACISYKYAMKYAEELHELKEKADSANQAKSAFLANMSHEIRTPINAVLTMDEMILRESMDGTIQDYAKDIKVAGNTLLALINDILDISKIESGKMELVKDKYQLKDICSDIHVLISGKAAAKGLKFELDVSPQIPSGLYGDSLRIKQIMINLLNNAVKYTEQGTVTLKITSRKSKNPKKTYLVIRIIDTGIGIKQEDMEKLFSKFERIEEKRNRNIEGTGLGMSITKQLVDMMHGKMEVTSSYGKGTMFTVNIPQLITDYTPIGSLQYDHATPEYTYAPSFQSPNSRILVVDDNAMNRKGIVLLLKQTLIQIDTAESGEECIQICREKSYDLIFLDHRMPGMSGMETLECLRKEMVYTPVIMLTANAVSGAKQEYLNAGFNNFLSKPVDPLELEKMLIQYLPKEKVTHDVIMQQAVVKSKEEKMEKPTIPEFSMEEALKKCITKEIFLEMAAEFVYAYDINRKRMEEARNAKDENYRILVHALKSNAHMIGLIRLSKMAEREEKRAAEEKWEYIEKSHKKLMKLYEKSYQFMRQNYYKDEEIECKTDEIFVREQLKILYRAAEEGDLDQIDTAADVLRDYRYPKKQELEEAVRMLDFVKIKEIVEAKERQET